MKKYLSIIVFSLICHTQSFAESASVIVFNLETNKPIGEVSFQDSSYGLIITPKLKGLPAGIHGFHLHEKADCSQSGMAAGGHFDPENTKSHDGPYGKGHLGDLPVLYVNQQQEANIPMLAPRLKMADLSGLSLMIHAGGDNYSNKPPLGGGGKRIACAVLNKTKAKSN